jgi:hypothetical protein
MLPSPRQPVRAETLLRTAGEFNLRRFAGARRAHTSYLPARWRMAYYSCSGLLIKNEAPWRFPIIQAVEPRCLIISSGPRGIRTPDLLNAIEARSQLRYGPRISVFVKRLPARTCRFVFLHAVDLRGFEPLTSSVRLRRAPNCATGPLSRGEKDFTPGDFFALFKKPTWTGWH